MVPLLALLALTLTGWAAESDWYLQPAARELHPVHGQVWLRWQRSMAWTMAGPWASVLYRDAANQADVYWRLGASTGHALPLEAAEQQRLLDLAVNGSVAAWEVVARDTLARDDELDTLRRVVVGVASPGIEVSRGGGSEVRVRANDRLRSGPEAIADMADPLAPVPDGARPTRPNGPPSPTLRTGTGWRLVRDPEVPDLLVYHPALTTFLQGTRLGIDAFRLEGTWSRDLRERPTLDWIAAAREAVHPRVVLLVAVQGDEQPHPPLHASSAAEIRLPTAEPWVLRLGTAWTWRPAEARMERRLEVQVRSALRWHIPADIDRWPLGQEPDAPGPWLPTIEDHGPNEVTPVIRAPVDDIR